MRHLIVVDHLNNWCFDIEKVEVISATEYLNNASALVKTIPGKTRVFNFCKSYKYQTIGYYVSLIAEARGDLAYPSMAAISDIKSQSIVRKVSEDLTGVSHFQPS